MKQLGEGRVAFSASHSHDHSGGTLLRVLLVQLDRLKRWTITQQTEQPYQVAVASR
jgi:hypothetical protein